MYSEPMSLTPAVFILFFWPLHFKNDSFSVILFVLKFELIVQCQIQLLDQLPNFVLVAHSFSLPAKRLLSCFPRCCKLEIQQKVPATSS